MMTHGKLITGGSSARADAKVAFAVVEVSPLLLSFPLALSTYSVIGATVFCRFCPSTVRGVRAVMPKPMCGVAEANPRCVEAVTNCIVLRVSLLYGGMKSLVCKGTRN